MENSHIEEWDLRGWMGVEDPTPHAQREWNKTLLQKINLISNYLLFIPLFSKTNN